MKASTGTSLLLSLAALGLGLPACASGGVARTANTTSNMESLEISIGQARRTLSDTLAALDEVQNTAGTDARQAFSRFCSGLEDVRSGADGIPRRAAALKSRAVKNDEEWLKETSTIQDGSLRRLAEERRAATLKLFEAIGEKALAVKAAYEPVIRRLTDIQTFLSNDLNPAGISAAGKHMAEVKGDAKGVDEALDRLAKEVAEVRVAMSSKQPAPNLAN